MRTITLAITTYQRIDYTILCIAAVLSDERISEIVVVDDCSDKETFDKLKEFCDRHTKIKLYYNISNQDCYRNKKTAVSYSSNPWCIIFDSDNILFGSYLDALYEIKEWNPRVVYQPVNAYPQFDFTEFSGVTINQHNVASYMDKKMFSTSLNAMNYFVNRDEYLRVWDGSVNPYTADSIYHNLRFLEAGNEIYFVPGMTYHHRVHDGSHYKINNHKTGNFYLEVENRLKQLS